MPIWINDKRNPSKIQIGHEQMAMVLYCPTDWKPGTPLWIVWKKYYPEETGEVVVRSIDRLLESSNTANKEVPGGVVIQYPMLFFDTLPPPEYQYDRKLTHIAKGAGNLSLETMDSSLVAMVINGTDLFFPMQFFDTTPENYDPYNKLTHITGFTTNE